LLAHFNKKCWRWNFQNWSSGLLKQRDQRFSEKAKIGLRLHTLQNFDRIAATFRSTNFQNSNANIFYFASSFLNRRVKMIKQLEGLP
jgi:hypothetical protein